MKLYLKNEEVDFIDGLLMYNENKIGFNTLAWLWQNTELGIRQDLRAMFKYFER